MNIPSLTDLTEARWTPAQAHAWCDKLPWLFGTNFNPSTAGNQLEMWQAETFDPITIDRELGWAASLGMTSQRVFLHDLLWTHDRDGFLARIDIFLGLAAKHRMGILFVLFDSCWHPHPRLGTQRPPELGVHNSMWVQSPGALTLRDPRRFAELGSYVTGLIRHFRSDARIHGWDVWNEPENDTGNAYATRDHGFGTRKGEVIAPYLAQTFSWARAAQPMQPLTSAVWTGDWSSDHSLNSVQRVQLAASDIISFHQYAPLARTQEVASWLTRFERPLWCSEYMARPTGSRFGELLPWFKEQRIGAYNWGFVAGRTQTQMPWDSWQTPVVGEPPEWFHEILRPDGTPYREEEVALMRRLTRETAT